APQPLQHLETGPQIIGPDVAAVDDTGDEADLLGNGVGQAARVVGVGGSGRGREVDAEGVDAGPGQPVQALAEAAVRGGAEQLRAGAGRGQGRIRPAGRLGEFVIARSGDVGDQSRLVELNPFDTGGGQDADDVEVDIGELREPVEGTRGRARCGFGQGEQGQ